MSGMVATPCSTARIASSRYGTSSRLTMNPELSFAATASLPSDLAKAKARRNASSDGVTVRRGELALLDELGERLFDAGARPLADLFGDVAGDRLVAGGRRDLGDAAAHQAAAEDSYAFDVAHRAHLRALRISSAMRTM